MDYKIERRITRTIQRKPTFANEASLEEAGGSMSIADYLEKPSKSRSNADFKNMIKLTEHLEFFKKNNKLNPTIHLKCCKFLEPLLLPKGKAVFFYGDSAELFYLLIEGSALVLTPKPLEQIIEERILKKKIINPFNKRKPQSEMGGPILSTTTGLETGGQLSESIVNSKVFPERTGQSEAPRIRTTQTLSEEDNRLSSVFQNNSTSKMGWKKAQTKLTVSLETVEEQKKVTSTPSPRDKGSFIDSESDPKPGSPNNFDLFDMFKSNKIYDKLMVSDLKDNADLYFEDGVFKYNIVKTIKSGESFGELALIRKKPRNATILCYENCLFGTLSKEEYKTILMDIENIKLKKLLEFFSFEVFKGIQSVGLENVVAITYLFVKTKYPVKQVLFKEKSYADRIFAVKKGSVEILKSTAYSNETDEKADQFLRKRGEYINKKFQVSIVQRGGLIGEDDIVLDRNRTYEARCLTKVTVYEMPRTSFERLLKDREDFMEYFLSVAQTKDSWHNQHLDFVKQRRKKTDKEMRLLSAKKTTTSNKQKYSTGLRSSVEDVDNYLNSEIVMTQEVDYSFKRDNKDQVAIDIVKYKAPYDDDLYFFRGKRLDLTKGQTSLQMIQPSSIANKIVDVVKKNRKALRILKKRIDKKMTRDELLAVYDKVQIKKNERHEKFLRRMKKAEEGKPDSSTVVVTNEAIVKELRPTRKISEFTGGPQASNQEINSDYSSVIDSVKAQALTHRVMTETRPKSVSPVITGKTRVYSMASIPIHTIFRNEKPGEYTDRKEIIRESGSAMKHRPLQLYDEKGVEKVNFHMRGFSSSSSQAQKLSRPSTSATTFRNLRGNSRITNKSGQGMIAYKILNEGPEEKFEWVNRDLPMTITGEAALNTEREPRRKSKSETESNLKRESRNAVAKYSIGGELFKDNTNLNSPSPKHPGLKGKKLVTTGHNFFRVLSGDNTKIKRRALVQQGLI